MRIKQVVTFLPSSVLFFTLAGTALAEDEMDDIFSFERVDTNGDECVNWEEMRNSSLQIFYMLDANRDNLIAGEEHPTAVNDAGEPVRPRNVDTSRFQAAMYVAFDTADKDKDGCLSRKEYSDD